MERIRILYWTITVLFSAFIIATSFGGLVKDPQAIAYLHDHLGYPVYFIQWISVWKIIGAVALLLPFVPTRIKEWAYFGFLIDLVTGMVSFIAVGDPFAAWAPMLLFITLLVAAYLLHHRRLALRAAGRSATP